MAETVGREPASRRRGRIEKDFQATRELVRRERPLAQQRFPQFVRKSARKSDLMEFRQGRHRSAPYDGGEKALQGYVIERGHKDAVFRTVRSLACSSQQLYASPIEHGKPLLAVFAKHVLPPAFARVLDHGRSGIIEANRLAGVPVLDLPEKRIGNDMRATKPPRIEA